MCFIDYENIFDGVSWERIFKILKLRQFPDEIVRGCINLFCLTQILKKW